MKKLFSFKARSDSTEDFLILRYWMKKKGVIEYTSFHTLYQLEDFFACNPHKPLKIQKETFTGWYKILGKKIDRISCLHIIEASKFKGPAKRPDTLVGRSETWREGEVFSDER